jgi:hypothetical protein
MKLFPWILSLSLLHAAPQWSPTELRDESTLEFLTVGPEEGDHWSMVWFVMIDDTLYVRLGPRAQKRIEQNTASPRLQVRSAGKEAQVMTYEKAPEKAEAVALAMRQKYWTDILGEPFRKLGLTSQTVVLRFSPESSR